MDNDRRAVKLAIEKMRLQNIDIRLSLKELRDAKRKYIKEVISDD